MSPKILGWASGTSCRWARRGGRICRLPVHSSKCRQFPRFRSRPVLPFPHYKWVRCDVVDDLNEAEALLGLLWVHSHIFPQLVFLLYIQLTNSPYNSIQASIFISPRNKSDGSRMVSLAPPQIDHLHNASQFVIFLASHRLLLQCPEIWTLKGSQFLFVSVAQDFSELGQR